MLFFALSGLLIGLLLGGLTVGALLPATIFVLVVASGSFAILGGEAFGPRMIEVVALVVGLQGGYLAGAATRFFVLEPAIRTARLLWSARAGSNSVNSPLRD